MKRRIIVALCLSAVTAAAVTAATLGATKKTTADSITVWLQVDAQSGWPKVVAAANKAFEKAHPGVKVNVQYQQWNTHLQKFDATLAGGSVPDVIEMGNTEMTKYMAAGAFADLTADKSKFPNSSTWLKGLTDSATYDGKLMGVPYYAGSRVVIYRHRPVQEGRASRRRREPSASSSPTASKLMTANSADKTFSAFYVAGQDWYSALAFVYDFGGQIATSTDGKWAGTLDQPRAMHGPERVQEHVPRALAGEQVDRRGAPVPDDAVLAGPRGVVRRPGLAVRLRARSQGRQPEAEAGMGAFPMPSHAAGKTMPAFLGGSDLAIPAVQLEPGPGRGLDRRLHGERADGGHRQGGEPPEHDLAPQPRQGHARARRSRSRRSRRGSSRPRRTGRTSRARTSCGPCSRTSSPARRPCAGAAKSASDSITSILNTAPDRTEDAGRVSSDPVPAPRQSMPPEQPSGRSGGVAVSTGHGSPSAVGAVRADRARGDRDRRDPRLPALLPRPALVPAVRPGRADRAQGPLDRARQLHRDPRRQRVLARRPALGGLHGRQRRPDARARNR